MAREARVLVCWDENENGVVEVLADTAASAEKVRKWLGLKPDEKLWPDQTEAGGPDWSHDFGTWRGSRWVWNKKVSGSLDDFYDPERTGEPYELEEPGVRGLEEEVIWLINNVDASEAYRILRTARALGGHFGEKAVRSGEGLPSTLQILHTAIVMERG